MNKYVKTYHISRLKVLILLVVNERSEYLRPTALRKHLTQN